MSEIDDLLRNLGFPTGEDPPLNVMGHDLLFGDSSSSHSPLFETASLRALRQSNAGDFNGRSSRTGKGTSTLHPWNRSGQFVPLAPDSLAQAGLHVNEVSDLLLKTLFLKGIESGYNLARLVGLKFPLTESVLRQLKKERLLSYRNSAAGGDYLYELTDDGRERARTISGKNSHLGTAPVPLAQYVESVKAQSLAGKKPPLSAIRAAFSDLQVDERLVSNLGQAIHSGRGMFLYGPAGNGKTSLAERITKSFGDTIWIPQSITAGGEIIRLFDPNRHRPAPLTGDDPELLDGRWVQIERPTIIAGGELRMENLEVTYIRGAGVGEAPLQMKANCGTLLIDDFGRQRMSTDELLNRWIVPLEQRYDYLHLESGRSVQVPFDELIIFSTNLQPRDLVDEAFLRRIPYKIEVPNPTEEGFRKLFTTEARSRGFECDPGVVDYLIQRHYIERGRTFRFCHARDLLRQVENSCTLHERDLVVTAESIDEAIGNYFAIMCDDAA